MRFIKFIVPVFILVIFIGYQCKEPSGTTQSQIKSKDTLVYLNHSDTAHYVGINTCKLCHQDIYNSFIKTGMGQSFARATKDKSAADFTHPSIYDKFTDLHYTAFWKSDSLFFREFKIEKGDTVFQRTEQVNYIIGSGQHTNSHLQSINGYINQMPMTFYTQKKKWDLPPGFEDGHNTRFTRKIGLECMSCHNALPDFELGSENKFNSVPEGINCERCHGPGSIHVAQRQTGSKVDTSKYIDYSIVNPSKLSIDRQFDVCMRCHLQGNAVLKEGKSFFDYKPGMKLSDFMTVFLPKYKNGDDEFIMASHADRLKQSQCFIQSYEKAKGSKSLKPYKDALTCVTCHNPHVSVKETGKEIFNTACNNCHGAGKKSQLECTEKTVVKFRQANNSQLTTPNCVNCHMPSSGSIDIPHVTVHDHYIRKPITKKEKNKIKEFIGLYAINEKNPDKLTRARAYINQFDKFEAKPEYLDSAAALLNNGTKEDILMNLHPLMQLAFSRQDFNTIITYVNKVGEKELAERLNKKSYDNTHAWTAYHIAEAYYNTGAMDKAVVWFRKACDLAPYNLEFRNKLGSAYMNTKNINAAKNEFKYIVTQHPKNISGYTNLGFLELTQNEVKSAVEYYNKGLALDLDYEPLLFNVAGLKLYLKDKKGAIDIVERILKYNPENLKAQQILAKLKSMS